jgi:hypothetical protein
VISVPPVLPPPHAAAPQQARTDPIRCARSLIGAGRRVGQWSAKTRGAASTLGKVRSLGRLRYGNASSNRRQSPKREPHVDLGLARSLVKLGNAAQYTSTMPETRRASRPRDLERLRIGRCPSDAFVRMKRSTLRGAIGVRRRRAYRGRDAKGGRDSHHARDPAHQLAAPHAIAGWRNRVEVQKDAIASGCVKMWTLRLRKKTNRRFVTRKEFLREIGDFKRRRCGADQGRVTAGRSGLAAATLDASPFHGHAPHMVWNQPREKDHRRLPSGPMCIAVRWETGGRVRRRDLGALEAYVRSR